MTLGPVTCTPSYGPQTAPRLRVRRIAWKDTATVQERSYCAFHLAANNASYWTDGGSQTWVISWGRA